MVQLSTPWSNRGMGPPWGAFCQIILWPLVFFLHSFSLHLFVSQKSLNDDEQGGNCLLVPERSYGPDVAWFSSLSSMHLCVTSVTHRCMVRTKKSLLPDTVQNAAKSVQWTHWGSLQPSPRLPSWIEGQQWGREGRIEREEAWDNRERGGRGRKLRGWTPAHYAWLWTLVQAINRTSGRSGSASEDDPAERGCSRSTTTLGSMPTTPGGSHMTASLGGRYDPWPVKRSTDWLSPPTPLQKFLCRPWLIKFNLSFNSNYLHRRLFYIC